jgi:hypothetical protein
MYKTIILSVVMYGCETSKLTLCNVNPSLFANLKNLLIFGILKIKCIKNYNTDI